MRILIWVVILLWGMTAHAEILPADRIIDWSLAGTSLNFDARTVPCATLSPNGVTDGTAIQTAISSAPCAGTAGSPKLILLNAGTYAINTMILWGNHPYVTLRGAGPASTILATQAAMVCSISGEGPDGIFKFEGNGRSQNTIPGSGATQRSIVGTLAKGATTLTTTVAHGWVVGDYVLIAALNDGSAGSPPNWIGSAFFDGFGTTGIHYKQQVVRLTAASGTTATFTPPTYWPYTLSPIAYKSPNALVGISIENLKTENLLKKCRGHAGRVRELFNSRFYNWEQEGMPNTTGAHFNITESSAENTFEHMYLHDSSRYDTDGSYGFFIGAGSSNNKWVDNILNHMPNWLLLQGAASGNVIAYNYSLNQHWPSNGGFFIGRFGASEHGGSSSNLWEGNELEGQSWCDGLNFKPISANYNLQFKNHINRNPQIWFSATQSYVPDQALLDGVKLEAGCYLWSFVGNVIGDIGLTTTRWQYHVDPNLDGSTADGQAGGDTSRTIWRIGNGGVDAFDTSLTGADVQVGITLIRYGNWSSVCEGGTPSTTTAACVTFDTHNIDTADTSLTRTSYYLSSKPTFFGSCAWPWINPLGASQATRVLKLPAKERYLGLTTCSGGGSDTTPPAAPTGVTIGRPNTPMNLHLVGGP